jgi:hypothetical protein
MTENFDVAEYLNFGSFDIQEESVATATQEPALWDKYPALFESEDNGMAAQPTALINFEDASLIKEEYVDPFSALLNKESRKHDSFLAKLRQRREKLEQMAQKLQTKNSSAQSAEQKDVGISRWSRIDTLETPLDCKQSPLNPLWRAERRSIQAFPIFELVCNFDSCRVFDLKPEHSAENHSPALTTKHSRFSHTCDKQQASEAEKQMAREMLIMFTSLMPEFLITDF